VQKKGQKKTGGYFYDELDAAKRANQLCEELEIPLLNPAISTKPSQQYQAKQKTYLKKQPTMYGHFGGTCKDELDAAKKVNQLCEEFGIPQYNPTISMQECQHDDYQTANLCDSEILETAHENAKKKKRKRPNQINDDNKLPVETYYFYDTNLLK